MTDNKAKAPTDKKTNRSSGHSRIRAVTYEPKKTPVKKAEHRKPTQHSRENAPSSSNKQARPARSGGHNRHRQARLRPAKTRTIREPRSSGDRKKGDKIPPLAKGNIRIVPLGGVEEIGKNITAIEIGDDIIVVDAGFQFSEVETPGIDYILPNVSYLEERKNKIKALFITHGHLDHIGGVPYLIEKMGFPPIYSREFGAVMITKRQEEFKHMRKLDIRIVKADDTIKLGEFKIKTFAISHAIPDSMGLIIETPHGDIVFVEDVRVDHVDGIATEKEVEHYKEFKDRNVLLFTLDSTRVETPGWSLPEHVAIDTIDKIMKETQGRLIIATFASQVERIIHFISAAEKYGKKVVVDGRSMKSNVAIIKQLKLLKMANLIPIEEMGDYPPDKIVVLATGAQGEEFAVLMRVANKTHKHIALTKNDTIILSSSIIPGNEMSIQKLKDNLYRTEAKIITYLSDKVHSGGHGYRGELEWIHKQVPYKFFMPVHGHHYMLRIHAELSRDLGTPEENIIVPDNGSIVEIQDGGKKLVVLKEKAPSDSSMVDGFTISGTQEVVIRDRKQLAGDGMFVIVVSVDPRTGKIRKSPDIISRGFVYLKGEQKLLNDTRILIKKKVEQSAKNMRPINFDYLKNEITDDVRKYLFKKTAKSPMVIPVVIGV